MNDKALDSAQIWRHTGRLILVDQIERSLADGATLGGLLLRHQRKPTLQLRLVTGHRSTGTTGGDPRLLL